MTCYNLKLTTEITEKPQREQRFPLFSPRILCLLCGKNYDGEKTTEIVSSDVIGNVGLDILLKTNASRQEILLSPPIFLTNIFTL
jgi:hypothetical protein